MTTALVAYQAAPDCGLFRRRGLLIGLQRQLRQVELEYARDVEELRRFELRYRPAVGDRYDELERLRARAGRGWDALARARGSGEGPESAERDAADAPAARPGEGARRIFLELARRIHPDLAEDESERRRRHEVMAEATLAYRDGDDRRLQWLLEHWLAESNPIVGFGLESVWSRTNRQIAWTRYRVREMRYALGQLHAAPIARIMQEHEQARLSGRNLIREMRRRLQAELERACEDLDRLGAAIEDLPPDSREAVRREVAG